MSFSRVLPIAAAAALLAGVAAPAATVRHSAPSGAATVHLLRIARSPYQSKAKCPPSLKCISVTASTPLSAEFCLSSTGNCSSGLVGNPTWVAQITILRDVKKAHELMAVWSPNPGNPSTFTLSTTAKKAKDTKAIASVALSVCSTSGCQDIETFGVTN